MLSGKFRVVADQDVNIRKFGKSTCRATGGESFGGGVNLRCASCKWDAVLEKGLQAGSSASWPVTSSSPVVFRGRRRSGGAYRDRSVFERWEAATRSEAGRRVGG